MEIMNHRLLRIIIILLVIAGSILTGVSIINFVSADNFNDFFSSLPSIKIESPNNNTIYSNVLSLNFTINYSPAPGFYEVYVWQLFYKIDNNTSIAFPSYNIVEGTNRLSPSQNLLLNITNLSSGQHQIELDARFFWYSPDFANDFYYPFEPIIFNVNNLLSDNTQNENHTSTPIATITPTITPNLTQLASPSMNQTPSLSPTITPSYSPTQQLTVEPSPTAHNIQAENFTPTIIILSIIAGAVAIGLLAYFAKHKGWK